MSAERGGFFLRRRRRRRPLCHDLAQLGHLPLEPLHLAVAAHLGEQQDDAHDDQEQF